MAAYMDDYTNRRKTRIYVRPSDHESTEKDDLIGQTQAIPIKKGLFDGLSVAQVVAGAAAAATSVALASQIGLAGSIIGAAVSSVVTVVSSQLYRRFLDASARKIKTAGNRMRSGNATDHAAADATEIISSAANAHGARVAPSKIRARAAAARSANQRKVIAFSVVIALVAVIACAAAILLGTEGAGLGEKTAPIIPAITREQPVDSGAGEAGAGDGAQTADGAADQADVDSAPGDTAAGDTAAGDDAGDTGSAGQADTPGDTGGAGTSDVQPAPETGSEGGAGEATTDESTPSVDNGGTEDDATASGGQGSSSQPSSSGQTGASR